MSGGATAYGGFGNTGNSNSASNVGVGNTQIVNHIQTIVRNRNPNAHLSQAEQRGNIRTEAGSRAAAQTGKSFFTTTNQNDGKRPGVGGQSAPRTNTAMQQFFAKFNNGKQFVAAQGQ